MSADAGLAPGQQLRTLFAAGVEAVSGDVATARALQSRSMASRVHLLALGKAADAMAVGAIRELDEHLARLLVVTKHHHLGDQLKADARCQSIESGHPQPDEHSLAAGAAVQRFVAEVPAGDHLLVLLSGGASALVEELIEGVTLADLQQVTERLLAGGYEIGEMNQVRRQLSCIKGGRLANAIPSGCPVTQLLISDVPGDRLDDIGSGPLIAPAPSPFATAELLQAVVEPALLTHRVQPPAADHTVWQQINTRIIASSAIAQAAVVEAARQADLPVVQTAGSLDGDVLVVADRVCSVLLDASAVPGLYVWGGEPTLTLPQNPGRGGRNQHLALLMAERLAAASAADIELLVCGTDGTDGPTGDAGGCVDGQTVARGHALGLDVSDTLARADAGSFLAATDALVTTGPTGTNVMDLLIAWKAP